MPTVELAVEPTVGPIVEPTIQPTAGSTAGSTVDFTAGCIVDSIVGLIVGYREKEYNFDTLLLAQKKRRCTKPFLSYFYVQILKSNFAWISKSLSYFSLHLIPVY